MGDISVPVYVFQCAHSFGRLTYACYCRKEIAFAVAAMVVPVCKYVSAVDWSLTLFLTYSVQSAVSVNT